MKRSLASLAILLASPGAAPAADAAELVMFEAQYCEWCEAWDEEIGGIYAKTEEGKCAPLRRVDAHGQRPDDLSKIRRSGFTPTFVLVENGEEIGRIIGYPGADFFWPLLTELLEKIDKAE